MTTELWGVHLTDNVILAIARAIDKDTARNLDPATSELEEDEVEGWLDEIREAALQAARKGET